MDAEAKKALAEDLVVDITTRGRMSNEPRRIEIWLHELDGRYFITGSPGKRNWFANLVADPGITVHLKKSHTADLKGEAFPILDRSRKRSVLTSAKTLNDYVKEENLDDWLDRSPLVEVVFD